VVIGIVTFHFGYNYGGFLQVYSLVNLLKSWHISVKVIDYRPVRFTSAERRQLLFFKPWFTLNPLQLVYINRVRVGNLIKIVNFIRLQRELEYFPFKRESDSQQHELIDYVIYGSDEIWNIHNPLIGVDLNYFGEGFDGVKKVSYAPSFGEVPKGEKLPDRIVENLVSFQSLSVRDNNSRELLKAHGLDSKIVLDPTLLVDVPSRKNTYPDDYLLVYLNYTENIPYNSILTFCRKHRLKLWSVGYPFPWCDRNHISAGPFEWLDLIRDSKFFITNTFHGVCFSVLLRKQFAIIPNKKKAHKIAHLTDCLGLMNHYVADLENLDDVLTGEGDFGAVYTRMEKLRIESIQFLKDNFQMK
jgi:hypothetical protein